MRLFLDTNVWLRYLIGDQPEQLQLVKKIMQFAVEGVSKLCTSTFILSEIIYVQQSFYQISQANIIEDLEDITQIRGIWLVENTNFHRSFYLFKMKRNRKWSDCVIASQVPANYRLCSFDARLKNLIGPKRFITPAEAIAEYGKPAIG